MKFLRVPVFLVVLAASASLAPPAAADSGNPVEAIVETYVENGWCAYIVPPSDVPWGGATVCTPWD